MVGDSPQMMDAFAPSLEEPYHLGICTQASRHSEPPLDAVVLTARPCARATRSSSPSRAS